ncbi:MAG: hypothetical protein ACK4RK_13215 [Gemmataceae bacterium]
MDLNLLGKLFGADQQWQGPCTVILDANATVESVGLDSIAHAGAKVYAPRLISGRINADAVCLVQEHTVLLMIQQQRFRTASGEETIKQSLIVADIGHVVGIEFPDTALLATLGLLPPAPRPGGSHSGMHQRPKMS